MEWAIATARLHGVSALALPNLTIVPGQSIMWAKFVVTCGQKTMGTDIFTLLTSMIALAASILFASYWLRGKAAGPWLMSAALLAGAAAPVARMAVSAPLEGLFLPLSLILGQAVCIFYHILHRDRLVFCELSVYACIDISWLPLCMCDSGVWQYAVYIAMIAAGVVMTLFPAMGRQKRIPVFSSETFSFIPWRYRMISFSLPWAAAVPKILTLLTAGEGSAVSGMLLTCAFLLNDAGVFWLQYEFTRRFEAESLCSTMGRWQSESRDYMNTIRAQRHDFNLHLQAMTGLISSGRYEECQAYIERLNAEAADVNDIMPVHDAAIGSMLYNMREEARRRGSDIVYNITYDMRGVLCNGFECIKIIGNLLRNAIDALHTQEDLAYGIRLDIFRRRGNVVIRTENRFTGDPDSVARAFAAGYSTKTGHEGIGLSMVRRTVEKYGGRVYSEFGEDTIRFVVNLPDKVQLQVKEADQYEHPHASS